MSTTNTMTHMHAHKYSQSEEIRHAYLTVPQLQYVMQQIVIVIEVRVLYLL